MKNIILSLQTATLKKLTLDPFCQAGDGGVHCPPPRKRGGLPVLRAPDRHRPRLHRRLPAGVAGSGGGTPVGVRRPGGGSGAEEGAVVTKKLFGVRPRRPGRISGLYLFFVVTKKGLIRGTAPPTPWVHSRFVSYLFLLSVGWLGECNGFCP